MPPLVQIMPCRLVGAKPLSDPVLVYYQLDPYKGTNFSEIEIHTFSFKKVRLKMSSVKCRPRFVSALMCEGLKYMKYWINEVLKVLCECTRIRITVATWNSFYYISNHNNSNQLQWASRRLISPATRLFIQELAQPYSKECTQTPYNRPFVWAIQM